MRARVSLTRSASIRLSHISLAQSIEYCSQAVGARVGGDGGGIGDEHGGDKYDEESVCKARRLIYEHGIAINGAAVQHKLKATSSVPTSVSI